MKYRYRVKHIQIEDNPIMDLISFVFMPILLFVKDKRKEWWEVQCKNHWWNPWHTCISYGGISINAANTKEQAIKKMEILKQNNVGYYDFYFDYKGPDNNREFYIKEKFDNPRYKLKTFEF